MLPNGPISTFQTIIIHSLGFTGLQSLLIVLPSGAYAGAMMLLITYLCYKFPGWRAYLIILCQLGTILAGCLLWKLPHKAVGVMLFALYILPSIAAGYAAMMGLFLANNAGYSKRSLASSGLYVGYCFGNFAGPLLFQSNQAPYYTTGWIVVVVGAIVAAALVLIYRTVCAMENKRRDASETIEAFEHANEDDLTDVTNPQFRYIL
ncbi:hypothetical protein LTR96_011129 [Exophiala xenobiotica]|nr:hypothetical protein LTR41_011257 [Exophiala xenobiotica]KAK5215789.1 hypothetical protein LTR72_011203 [Exophiala xenobiotica]KAK5220903.1 hypothetical protein LTR47_011059 [Exophiala xenobiotica]KAK5245546.1 hypothetical protein LTS06_009068 [Exophiala xenobiotica]KAK5263495.1 hypothetical protein LTR96_011129 [Exophiala xenobiotica]